MRALKRGHKVVALAAAGMLLAAGCGGDDDSSAGSDAQGNLTGPITEGGEVSVHGCKPERPLLPADTAEVCGGDVLDNVTAKLVRYHPETGALENDLAESIETKDSKTFTVKLLKGVKFHDGTEVDADSFIDAWNFAAYAKNAQQNASFFSQIQGFEDVNPEDPDGDGPKDPPEPEAEELSGLKKVNDTTFTITLARRNSTFPIRLGYTAFSPLPDSFFKDKGKAFGKKPIGAGPFKLVTFNPDREIVLEKDPNYDRARKPHIDKVIYRIYTSEDAAYADVQANQLDITNIIPTSKQLDRLYARDLAGRFATRAEGVFQSITFPPTKTDPSYENPKLRQAISMAIDREQVIKLAFPEREPATGWVSPVVNGFKAGACGEFCTFDPDRAKQLFEEAGGYTGTMTLSYNGGGNHEVWTEAVCNSIRDVLGVECIAKGSVDFASFRSAIEAKEQKGMFRTGWQMDYPSIENFLEPIYKTGASSNDGNYSNKEFDKLLNDAAAAESEEEGYALYQQAEALLAADMPAIPLWYGAAIHGHSNKVTNVKVTVFGTYDFSSVTVIK
ncbi:peptide ABC transporter substrate-binding protein [Sporichthya polymorpha]|uniref:peptide ABC transporter substrate-binding protein n=1 Tax=Sporichthya polymorpha TaxID=35751 RepID=UPI00048B23D8|nr:ABC transporter substrate-binding protein [Sporichthya polymorpha]